ncbi:hypothetical protein TWF481_010424 [Arthrobotrys musiformis]|uniref:Uncharacterized protein n=1 Tax=Arthrobotrys musiformis TaxID=47236 RepID=A0AAV9W0S4_9PEZI
MANPIQAHWQGAAAEIPIAKRGTEQTTNLQRAYVVNNIGHVEITLGGKGRIKSHSILFASIILVFGAILIKKDYVAVKITSAIVSFLGLVFSATMMRRGLNRF